MRMRAAVLMPMPGQDRSVRGQIREHGPQACLVVRQCLVEQSGTDGVQPDRVMLALLTSMPQNAAKLVSM